VNFKEKSLYKIKNNTFECYRVEFPYFYFRKLDDKAIYKLHNKCDYFALVKFVECTSLEKELT
jgi:hypothetical protein